MELLGLIAFTGLVATWLMMPASPKPPAKPTTAFPLREAASTVR